MREHADECERARKVTIGAGRVVENAWEGLHGLRYTQMCNLPVQGICADCMMLAIAYAHVELGGVLVAMVHDELLAEVPEADAPTVADKLKGCLHQAFVETFPGAPPRSRQCARWCSLGGSSLMLPGIVCPERGAQPLQGGKAQRLSPGA